MRNLNIKPLYEDRDWLYFQYIMKGLSMKKIGELCNCSETPIQKYLKIHKIPSRPRYDYSNHCLTEKSKIMKDLWKEGKYSHLNYNELAKKTKECRVCGKEFYPKEMTKKRQKYCSFECQNNEHRDLNRYGLTYKQIDNLLIKQNNCCGICNKKISRNGELMRTFVIDHSHKGNRVRGLLCRECNIGLGHFKDNPMILYNAIKYLKRLFNE